MARWETQVTLNLSLKGSATCDCPDGAMIARPASLNFIITTNRVISDVRLKFQLRVAEDPSRSLDWPGVSVSAVLDAVSTGRGSNHVTLPPSETEDYWPLEQEYTKYNKYITLSLTVWL